jgi:hypothetical protein
MDIIVLLLIAIFVFAAATLFRSNKALERVEDVERELGLVEDKIKEVEEKEASNRPQ